MRTLLVSGRYCSHSSVERYFHNSAVLNGYAPEYVAMGAAALVGHLVGQRFEWNRGALACHDCPMSLSAFSLYEVTSCGLGTSQLVAGSTVQTHLIVTGRAEHLTRRMISCVDFQLA